MNSDEEREARRARARALTEKYSREKKKDKNSEFEQATKTCCGRAREIFKIMIPIGSAQLCEIVIDLANIYFSAHYPDPKYLAANGLSISMMNIIGLSTMYGLAMTQDTLASQAFGAKNYRKAGHYLNVTRLVVLITAVFILLPMFMFAGNFLALIGI